MLLAVQFSNTKTPQPSDYVLNCMNREAAQMSGWMTPSEIQGEKDLFRQQCETEYRTIHQFG